MADDLFDDRLSSVPMERREVIRGMLLAGAVATPVVTSILLGGAPALADSPDISGATTTSSPTTPAATTTETAAETTVAPETSGTTTTTTTTSTTPVPPPSSTTDNAPPET